MSVNGKTATILPPVVDAGRQVVSNTGISRRTFSRIPTVLEMPNLVQVQIESFDWFVREGLQGAARRDLADHRSPQEDGALHLRPALRRALAADARGRGAGARRSSTLALRRI